MIVDNGDEYRLDITKKTKNLTIEENEDGEIVLKIYSFKFDTSIAVIIEKNDIQEIIEFLNTYK